ncbi:hypothetical protein MRB53_041383 [Persea americana]|nr:hypothetical protein MRB53_041383 [Persea americana]
MEAKITYCNDTWYEISRVPKEDRTTENWIDYVIDEDRSLVRRAWEALVQQTQAATLEFRFKTPWRDRTGTLGDTWVLLSAYPEKYDDGSLKSIFGSVTNISEQKWAEGFQKRKMEEAVELKREYSFHLHIYTHKSQGNRRILLISRGLYIDGVAT